MRGLAQERCGKGAPQGPPHPSDHQQRSLEFCLWSPTPVPLQSRSAAPRGPSPAVRSHPAPAIEGGTAAAEFATGEAPDRKSPAEGRAEIAVHQPTW